MLNAADGKFNVNTGPSFYRDTKITYHGVEAFDMPSFDLSPFFYPAASFIKNALSSPAGESQKGCRVTTGVVGVGGARYSPGSHLGQGS